MTRDISDALAQVRESIDWLKTVSSTLRAEADELRKELDKRREQDADQRRRGEQGPEWKILQQRIDLNQTTYIDIMTGLDQSREAKRVREYISQGLPKVKAAFDRAVLEDEDGSYAELQTALDTAAGE
ncbi:MAG: hypothetical protein LBJ02_04025 [Bifidobacteriaceae bacterium]|jgi:hypothetical protein|nr:hypothetical protein [Bifidobacteriaceae bacterium]